MATGFLYHPRFLEHVAGPTHPERPDRLRAIIDHLQQSDRWNRLTHLPFEPASPDALERVHDPGYIRRVAAACRQRLPYIDSADSGICSHSYDVALLAAGACLAAVDAVMAARVDNAFAAVRPPGHHAERGRSMGFCLFNNVAVAAAHLVERHRLDRVAIVDIDVHHGNGTQHIFDDRRDVLFISLHEHPIYLYPGSGFAYENGRDDGEGFTLNVPMQPGADDAAYRDAMRQTVLPRLERFDPQFLLISAGFDTSPADPLAHIELSPQGVHWMARQLLAVAGRHCGGRAVAVLEGGYDLRSTAEGAGLVIDAMLDASAHADHLAMKAGLA